MRKILLLSFLCAGLLAACSSAKPQPLETFYSDAKIEKVDKVTIFGGTTGNEKTITDEEQIDEFLVLIKDIEFTPQKDQSQRNGVLYTISLFDGDKKFIFSLNQIGKTYYDTAPDIYPIVKDYYSQPPDVAGE